MATIGFRIWQVLLWLISLLPMWLLYLFSHVLYLFLFRVTRYRRKVVEQNFLRSFPTWRKEELQDQVKQYYRHLADIIVETVKLTSASPAFIQRRCSFKNPEIFHGLIDQGKSFLIIMGHTGNWEWAGASTALHFDMQMQAIYRPISNNAVNMFYQWIRSRFGAKPVAMANAFEAIAKAKPVCATVFIADQAPSPQKAYWLKFLNQKTPVFRGIETIARKTNQPVVFANLIKTARGFYTIELELLSDNPASTPEGDITLRHVRRLEACIIEQPYNWLWSHKRWKHTIPENAKWIGPT